MVQKELGERLFAVPRTKAYAAVSVLTQLACELERARPVARSAFRPRPNVDSAFVSFARRAAADDGSWRVGAERLDRRRLRRRGPARAPRLRPAAQAARDLARGRAGAPAAVAAPGGRALARADVARALEAVGASPTARPEELDPERWLAFARALGWLAAP